MSTDIDRRYAGFDLVSQMTGTVETSVTTAVTEADKFTLVGGTFTDHAEILRLVKGGMDPDEAVRKVASDDCRLTSEVS